MTGIGRKILVKAKSEANLAKLLRTLADTVDNKCPFANVDSPDGIRLMRPLRHDEEDCYLDVRELP